MPRSMSSKSELREVGLTLKPHDVVLLAALAKGTKTSQAECMRRLLRIYAEQPKLRDTLRHEMYDPPRAVTESIYQTIAIPKPLHAKIERVRKAYRLDRGMIVRRLCVYITRHKIDAILLYWEGAKT